MKNLISIRKDMKSQLAKAEKDGKLPTIQVKEWLRNVEDFMLEVELMQTMPHLGGGGAAAHARFKQKIAEMESIQIENIDPVKEFLTCKQESGYECELFK
ncbi:hypothetical protein Q3G72_031190 [Acer saccharum]|nr:hypothetical protein Q3G72_031190 [Acer saccharum]